MFDTDQAAGLRNIAPAPALSLMAFPLGGPASGCAAWVGSVALAMRAMGMRPVIIDASGEQISLSMGVHCRLDLLDLLEGRAGFSDVAGETPDGVWVLRADRGVEEFVASGAPAGQLFGGFARLSQGFDSVLLAMPSRELACLAAPQTSVPVVSFEVGVSGMTQAYVTVKQLAAQFGYSRFALALRGAHDGNEAVELHERFAGTAREYLDVDVTLAGWTPAHAHSLESADALRRVTQNLLQTAATPVSVH
jgi:flagellar biosynthesis protein FlhG